MMKSIALVLVIAVLAFATQEPADQVVPEQHAASDVMPLKEFDSHLDDMMATSAKVQTKTKDDGDDEKGDGDDLEGPIDDATDLPSGHNDMANGNLHEKNSEGLNKLTGGTDYESNTLDPTSGTVTKPYVDGDAKLSKT